MGSCSGLLIAIMGSCVVFALNFGGAEATLLVLGCFAGGWIVSSCFLLLGARTLSKVLARGFLLGAAEWLLMIGEGVIRASRMETISPAVTGAVVRSQLVAPPSFHTSKPVPWSSAAPSEHGNCGYEGL